MNLIHYAFVTVDKRASIGCISNVTSSHPDPHSYLTKAESFEICLDERLVDQTIAFDPPSDQPALYLHETVSKSVAPYA